MELLVGGLIFAAVALVLFLPYLVRRP